MYRKVSFTKEARRNADKGITVSRPIREFFTHLETTSF